MPQSFNANRAKQHLKDFNFKKLFIEEMGWDNTSRLQIPLRIDETDFNLTAIASKRFLTVFECQCDSIPNRATQKKIHARLRKSRHENFIIFTDKKQADQQWFFVWRDPGKTIRAHIFEPTEDLLQRLELISFSIEEEENLSPIEVLSRVRSTFDVARVTRKFFDQFKDEHSSLSKFLQGIPDEDMKAWYVSVILNRLMFVYFIQKKGFLDNNLHYLQAQLAKSKQKGVDRYYHEFLCPLFFKGFALKEQERDSKTRQLLGDIPYLNGGIFQQHQVEHLYGKAIQIPDEAFEHLFNFFDEYRWHLDDRPMREDNEINPDVLGYIFEKYINQKQMGAYYTKEDITGYISRNTIIPWLFDQAKTACRIAFEGQSSVWDHLKEEPDRYIYPAVRKGCGEPLPANISAGIDDVSQRGDWNTPADETLALPTEIWRETVARRQRYEEVRGKLERGELREINDLITYNLNIELFAQDVIQNAEGPELVRAFWKALTNIKVLDPTVGSGAFLFAAMNILEPLYEDCIEQMEHFTSKLEQDDHIDKFKDFKSVLKKIKDRASLKYYIYKMITINNLYGVDIMEEAVETCKLRLFLKLVSQVGQKKDIEPLPDVDFNVRAGNSLVGFTSLGEVEKAFSKTKQNLDGSHQDALLMLPEENSQLNRIKEEAELASKAYTRFQQMQTEQGMSAADFRVAKQELQNRLDSLNDELNRALVLSYGVNPQDESAYQKWLGSHLPFHWYVDFYEIIQQGGFDVIIGNPPYVEYSNVRGEYTIQNYQTESCGNLYAYVIENCHKIFDCNGRFSMIVQLPIVCTDRMIPLQEFIHGNNSTLWFSNFDDRPGKLFDGLEHIRATIFIFHKEKSTLDKSIFSTKYNRWYSETRSGLFENISYASVSNLLMPGAIPKLGTLLATKIFKKIKSFSAGIEPERLNIKGISYFHNAPQYWVRATDFIPYFWNEREGEKISSQIKSLTFNNLENSLVITSLLNSSLFYWWYIILSDCRHLNMREIDSFPVNLTSMTPAIKEMLSIIVNKLMNNYELTKNRKETQYKTTGKVIYDEYFPKISKAIIDEIDRILARHYGFTDEELDFIINYDIKYRMGDELADYVEQMKQSGGVIDLEVALPGSEGEAQEPDISA